VNIIHWNTPQSIKNYRTNRVLVTAVFSVNSSMPVLLVASTLVSRFTKVSRYATKPAAVNYRALWHLAKYLCMMIDWGLIYWRAKPVLSLPVGDFQSAEMLNSKDVPDFPAITDPLKLTGYVDAAHGTDHSTRRFVTGFAFTLCGAAIAFKVNYRILWLQVPTEAEFLAAVHAAKVAKHLRTVLAKLGHPKSSPTTLYEDNAAAIMMINAHKPTERSRHIDIQFFAIQEWKDKEDIVMCNIPGTMNPADDVTKPLASTLHHWHCQRLMGHYGVQYETS